MSTRHTCDGRTNVGYFSSRCGKGATYEHNGRWYCKTHHPPTVEEKCKARQAARQKEWERKLAVSKAFDLAKAEQKRRADCFPELLAAAQKALAECCDLAETDAGQALETAIAKATGGQA